MTEERKFREGYRLAGLCYCDGCLYVTECSLVESDTHSNTLAAYRVHTDSGDITLLDRLDLRTSVQSSFSRSPRVDRHSHRVFVPCGHYGITVARLHGDRLVRERTLTSVIPAVSVDVMFPDTVYMNTFHSVHIVDVRDDRITLTLQKPDTKHLPTCLAVMGDSIIVGDIDGTLILYRHGNCAPVRIISCPGGLQHMHAVSTDRQSHFMLTDISKSSVLVMDVNMNLLHTVKIRSQFMPLECTVVNSQLWVGCLLGDIVILSSQ